MSVIKRGNTIEVSIPGKDSGMWVARSFFNGQRDIQEGKQWRRKNKKQKKAARKQKKHERQMPYDMYMRSKLWSKRRTRFFATHERRCVICSDRGKLQVHHIVYWKQGNEKDDHLAIMCEFCHQDFHDKYGSSGNMTVEWQLYLNDCKS